MAEEEQPRVWRDARPEAAPHYTVENWQIIETTMGQRAVIGRRVDSQQFWVSPALEGIDPFSRRVKSKTGHIYQLVGPPGLDAEMAALWPRVVEARGIEGWIDVSSELQQAPAPGSSNGTNLRSNSETD